jgi:hypothetical protein
MAARRRSLTSGSDHWIGIVELGTLVQEVVWITCRAGTRIWSLVWVVCQAVIVEQRTVKAGGAEGQHAVNLRRIVW